MPTAAQLVAQGQRLYQEGSWQQALPLLQEALGLEANHAQVLHLLGLIALQSGRPQQAADAFGRALASRPDDPELLTLLGAAWQAVGRFER
jgi:Flp pilus assembly protein TadD